MRSLAQWIHVPVAAAVFAGGLGAGLCEALQVLAHAPAGAAAGVLALALALYGLVALSLAVLLGWSAAVIRDALPGGVGSLRADPRLDDRLAGAIAAGALGALALAAGAGLAYARFIAPMASRTLATLATAGLTAALVPVAVIVALACRGIAEKLVCLALPRSPRLGRAGVLLGLLAALGVLAGAAGLSRADWRVLDLGPLKAAVIAVVLGAAHGAFWYSSAFGRRQHARLPVKAIRSVALIAVVALVPVAAGLPEGGAALQAAADDSWGLRLGLRLARAVTDNDGDGFSAKFGGGDCDDRRADVFPGAEDTPGDGIDQNCEGGDAKVVAAAAVAIAQPAPAVARSPGAGTFDGNILIVSVDALRGDRLGVAGYRRDGKSLTPTLDALAQRSSYFRRVWSQAPNTPRSFPSLVTSRFPSEIAWTQRSLNYSPILPSNETFFDHLARAGLRAVGIFSHFYFTADRGIGKGFAEWNNQGAGTIAESNKDIAAPRIVPRVVARLEKAAAAGERFVLWTHLFEPHSSYMEHAEFPSTQKGVAGLEERYDLEIAFVDRWIGKIVAALDRTGLAARTAVVVLADHGEAWGEHKNYFHGQDLTEEQLRVPLIISIPGRAPASIDDAAMLADVGPTLLDLVGAVPPAGFRGRSLLPAIDGKPLPPRPVFAELLPATAWPKHETMMVDGHHKLLHLITDRRWELYDLAADPKQIKDLARDPAQLHVLEGLRAKLLAFEERRR